MKPIKYHKMRGYTVLTGFLCALFIGISMVTSISDYTVLINNVLGVKKTTSAGADSYAFSSEFKSTEDLLSHRRDIAEQISAEGCVLLKNENNALPLNSNKSPKKVTVLGSRAYTYDKNNNRRDSSLAFYAGIVGSPIREQTVKLNDGKYNLPITLENAFKSQNIEINPAMVDYYTTQAFPNLVKGSEANGSQGASFSINEPNVSLNNCGNYSSYSDACFVVIGRASGEGREYLPGANGIEDKSDGSKSALNLSNDERNLIDVANKISDKVVVLINSAVAMEIDELKNSDKVDSILWIGLPGSYGMNGVSKVISGELSPSGHLPDIYAVDASASPAAQNFGVVAVDNSGSFTWSNERDKYNHADNSHYVVLAEDMYTGYYYYETRYADAVENLGDASSPVGLGYGSTDSTKWKYEDEVAYSFGYGMSYSSFTQEIIEDSLKADYENKSISLDVKIKNNGDIKAKDVVQLYVSSPYTDYDRKQGIEKPAIQLVNFEKVELEPNEEKTITISCDMKYFASYDKTISHDGVVGGYILENDSYYFSIGNGAHEALNNTLVKKGISESSLYLEDGSSINSKGSIVWNPSLTFDSNGVNVDLLSTSESGTTIQNQLEDADYNYFENNTITYLSRNDWKNTFPKPYVGLKVTSSMYDFLDSDVYKFSVGQVETVFGVDHSEEVDDEGNPLENLSIADMKLKSYDDEQWQYLVEEITFDEAWALSPYGGASCNSFLSVNSPEVWQIDGPNGNITRNIGAKASTSGPMAVAKNDPNASYIAADMCCEPMTAATYNKELVKEQGKCYGEEMLWSCNTIAWAPGMNLHRTPFNSRNHEYYSEDPMLTNILGTYFVEGGLEKGAILAAKHFAFNTQESFREGLCQFMEEQSARELELRAFQGLSEDVNFVNSLENSISSLGLMTSFSRIGVAGVNAHTGLMKNILRGEWGYKGLISTDMVVGGRFFNPEDSVVNNVTFMATSNAENLLNNFWPEYNDKNKVKNDPVLCKALSENMHYYMYSIANSNALNGYDSDTVVDNSLYGWQYAIKIIYWVLGAGTIVLAAACVVVDIKSRKDLLGGDR